MFEGRTKSRPRLALLFVSECVSSGVRLAATIHGLPDTPHAHTAFLPIDEMINSGVSVKNAPVPCIVLTTIRGGPPRAIEASIAEGAVAAAQSAGKA